MSEANYRMSTYAAFLARKQRVWTGQAISLTSVIGLISSALFLISSRVITTPHCRAGGAA